MVAATVSVNGVNRPALLHQDIVPGPATIEIDEPDQFWTIRPTIILTSDPAEPVVMEATLENPDGTIVEIPRPGGGTRPAQCQWVVDEVAVSPLLIRLSIRSV
jgi:hypothetical protein